MVPPTEPCALRSTQPLKVSTRIFSWGKGGRCLWLTTYHLCSAETSRKSGTLTYPEPLGPPRAVAGDLYFIFTYICKCVCIYVSIYMYICKYVCKWCVYVCMYICMYVCVCARARAHVCVCVCVCVCLRFR